MLRRTTIRQGLYCPIPECAPDAERLWQIARPVEQGSLPPWLAPKDAELYRWIATEHVCPTPDERARAAAEIAELEALGVVAEHDPVDRRVRRLYVPRRDDDVWSIAIYRGDSPLTLAPVAAAAPALTRNHVSDATAIAVADPFLTRAHGRWYMFFEVMTWPFSKGEIAFADSDDGVRWTYRQIVLAEPFHLSYPYVFEWDNVFYMIPESSQAKAVRLYRATDFPFAWTVVDTLLHGERLMDPSILRYDDRWWLFVETSRAGRHDTLRLYVATTLTGPWHEHPRSPIVQHDAQLGRPAGRILVYDGRIIRFAQNCASRYGTDVRAVEITELTPSRYAERELSCSPLLVGGGAEWNRSGMHHVDACRLHDRHWLAAVDGRAAHQPL